MGNLQVFDSISIFVSSRMKELERERVLMKEALEELGVEAWVFEEDAGARPESVVDVYLEEVEKRDVYVGVFWCGYGPHTIREYEHARAKGKDCLIYERRDGIEHRDPRLAEFLARLNASDSGVSVKRYEEPEELGEQVKKDVLGLQSRAYHKLMETRGRPPARPTTPNERSLTRLRDQVQHFWIEGVLGRSLQGETNFDVTKEELPGAVQPVWGQILQLPDDEARALPPGQPMVQVFDRVRGSLLILGAPGSGKTTTLLRLCRQLLDRTREDPTYPVATYFNLATWRGGSLDAWMRRELAQKYRVGKKDSEKWLNEGRLILLFDGLDEVTKGSRRECVEAINALLEGGGVPGLVVCSRMDEYEAIPIRLKMDGAILLQHLSVTQAQQYLQQFDPHLEGLQHALEIDEELQTLATTPLMLEVMRLACWDAPTEELVSEDEDGLKSTRRDQLLQSYVAKLLARKGDRYTSRERGNIMRWLGWLAEGMRRHQLAVFMSHYLSPTWLLSNRQYSACLLAVCLVGGLGMGYLGWRIHGPIPAIILAVVAILASVISYISAPYRVESAIVFQDTLPSMKEDLKELRESNPKTLTFVLFFLVITFVMVCGITGLAFGIKFDLQTGLIAWAIQFVWLAGFFAMVSKWPHLSHLLEPALKAPAWGVSQWILFGLFLREGTAQIIGLASAYWAGAPLVVYGILRIGFVVMRLVPIRPVRFLDTAVQLAFLKKVGPGYIFSHRLLLEHLATSGGSSHRQAPA